MNDHTFFFAGLSFFSLIVGFSLLFVIARRVKGLALVLTWLVLMAVFFASAELHMLHGTATSWDYAFAIMYQALPLMLGGTIGAVYGTYRRNMT